MNFQMATFVFWPNEMALEICLVNHGLQKHIALCNMIHKS